MLLEPIAASPPAIDRSRLPRSICNSTPREAVVFALQYDQSRFFDGSAAPVEWPELELVVIVT